MYFGLCTNNKNNTAQGSSGVRSSSRAFAGSGGQLIASMSKGGLTESCGCMLFDVFSLVCLKRSYSTRTSAT